MSVGFWGDVGDASEDGLAAVSAAWSVAAGVKGGSLDEPLTA